MAYSSLTPRSPCTWFSFRAHISIYPRTVSIFAPSKTMEEHARLPRGYRAPVFGGTRSPTRVPLRSRAAPLRQVLQVGRIVEGHRRCRGERARPSIHLTCCTARRARHLRVQGRPFSGLSHIARSLLPKSRPASWRGPGVDRVALACSRDHRHICTPYNSPSVHCMMTRSPRHTRPSWRLYLW